MRSVFNSVTKFFILVGLFLSTSVLLAQQKTVVTGVVKSADGPIQGATVTVKNTFNEVVTNQKGEFSIKVTQDDTVLEVSSFAMEYKELIIQRDTPMKIKLDYDGQLLDEVLIKGKKKSKDEFVETAYGRKNTKSLGYSTGQEITEEDIRDTDITVFDILRKMPGVEIFGMPGFNQSILFTRNRTITSQAPRVVLDGALLDQSILNSLSPSEISSIKLLKGLTATLRYGQLGSGGIIFIVTKLGKGNNVSTKEKIKSLQVKGNEYVETVPSLATVNNKSTTLSALEKATTLAQAKAIFKKQEKTNTTIPFYIESSEYFLKWDKEYSFEILSTIASLAPNNIKALKAYAFILEGRGAYKKVVNIYNRILALRPDSSQSYRDLALAYEAAGDYELALTLLYQIVYNTIPNVDCSGIQELAYNELRHLLAFHKNKVSFEKLPNELLSLNFKKDIRIVFEWTQPDVDFDVQFVSPERKFFNWTHTRFESKSLLQEEVSQGYAIKEHIIDDAQTGPWIVNMEFLSTERPKNPTYLKYTVFQDYGLPTQTKNTKIIAMKDLQNKVTIDRFVNK
ncbi:carboxypeptidase-like regulatory domain-containing protein [Flavobacteriaceae bacterium]|nr:carboxypeptidase-like regulatory domain-containing protein [Flavobacteriaceae bacterium]MDC0097074.1 carboxypeptidase-like regulatory domain-containing protein [Flavobacteriaceae bacterium]MDC0341538.1 carboxypeptidase-like regulatory domain-containing protein [Flavobacteriaceae bacterium]